MVSVFIYGLKETKMRTKAKEYIINNWGENWTRVQWNSDDVIDALAEFAEQQLKNCNIPDVSNNEVAVCDHEWTRPIINANNYQCCKCGVWK